MYATSLTQYASTHYSDITDQNSMVDRSRANEHLARVNVAPTILSLILSNEETTTQVSSVELILIIKDLQYE